MSNKQDQKKKDGERKDKNNAREHEAEHNPEEKARASAVTDRTEKGHSAGADAPGASGSSSAKQPDAN